MKIKCTRCANVREVKPDELLGRYYICHKCHNVFLWERKNLVRNKSHYQKILKNVSKST
jgi:hypothetical protein